MYTWDKWVKFVEQKVDIPGLYKLKKKVHYVEIPQKIWNKFYTSNSA